MLAVGAAKLAIPAGDRTHDDDAVADVHITHVGTNFNHLAQAVVADDHRQKRNRRHFGGVLHGILAHVQVTVIEPRAQHPD